MFRSSNRVANDVPPKRASPVTNGQAGTSRSACLLCHLQCTLEESLQGQPRPSSVASISFVSLPVTVRWCHILAGAATRPLPAPRGEQRLHPWGLLWRLHKSPARRRQFLGVCKRWGGGAGGLQRGLQHAMDGLVLEILS